MKRGQSASLAKALKQSEYFHVKIQHQSPAQMVPQTGPSYLFFAPLALPYYLTNWFCNLWVLRNCRQSSMYHLLIQIVSDSIPLNSQKRPTWKRTLMSMTLHQICGKIIAYTKRKLYDVRMHACTTSARMSSMLARSIFLPSQVTVWEPSLYNFILKIFNDKEIQFSPTLEANVFIHAHTQLYI